jgi:hypothetical protein
MKKLIVLAACMGVTGVAFGQGQYNLNNRVVAAGIDARVTDEAGDPLNGDDGYVVQAYMSDSETGAFSPIAGNVATFRNAPVPQGLGYLNGAIATVDGVAAETSIWIKLYAFSTADGATYEEAMAAGGAVGMSNPVPVALGGGTVQPPDLEGLQGFSLSGGEIIPEPSTFALGLIGIGALMLRRRK